MHQVLIWMHSDLHSKYNNPKCNEQIQNISNINMKIIFMGTSAFAVPVLQGLINSQHDVVAVYTKAPSKQSRGMKAHKSLTHNLAEQHGIPVVTPTTLKGHEALDVLNSFEADVIVVAAYGLIIPQQILDSCKYGCINVHPSDLPRWRGAAPIQRSMMSCDENTAICIMQMDAGIDTGPIFMKEVIPLDQDKDIHQLTRKYAEIGTKMLLKTLDDISKCIAIAIPQSLEGITYAHKITTDEEKIDWYNTATVIHAKIRALTPNAYCIHNNMRIKVVEAIVVDVNNPTYVNAVPGTVFEKNLSVLCGGSTAIQITKLQRSGGKILNTKDFLCGYKIVLGDTFL